MQDVDKYLSEIIPSERRVLEHIRSVVRLTVPEATEAISYGLPTFRYYGKNLLHFGAFKDHLSLFPTGDSNLGKVKGLDKFKASKGTLQFTVENQIPDDVIREIIAIRVKTINQGAKNE